MSDPRNEKSWAQPVPMFQVGEMAQDAPRGNVEGRRPVGPLQGFGQLWQKTYQVSVPVPTPEELIETWKEDFGAFWPKNNTFYPPAGGIAPGEVAVIVGGRGPTKVTTGVRVIYADERSWTYMNPEGHPWAGMITFSSHESDDGTTVAHIQLLVRANDPLYEIIFPLYASRAEDKIWLHMLRQVAVRFGIPNPEPTMNAVKLDKKRQWRQWRNIWKNSFIRTLLRRDRNG